MMYEVPEAIFAMFDDPENIDNARKAVAEWIRALPMKPNDWVWTPEHGWLMKENYGLH